MTTTLLWLRRDLRRRDHPALAAGAAGGSAVLPVYVIDPTEAAGTGQAKSAWLAATLRATAAAFDGQLCLRLGDPAQSLLTLARETGAVRVQVSAETEPDGRERDLRVAETLAAGGVAWAETGSPYAITPGRVRNLSGKGYRVFGAFERAWRALGWSEPAAEPERPSLVTAPSDPEALMALERWQAACPVALPPAGEAAARRAWDFFRADRLERYAEDRDRADLPATSQLSPYLALGVIHPRTLLADLAGRTDPGTAKFVSELAWREFYADVLWHRPESLSRDLVPTLAGMAFDEPDASFEAWREGRTGYPLVDAGMRQLQTEGWLPNRVRMVAASFLLKDLHLPWRQGARHFRDRLIDYDAASNTHNWQWVAGTGTDAAPYHRVFNPVNQSTAADPDGAYVRRQVPELAHLPGPAALRPWEHPEGYVQGYPTRILDHAAERSESLSRYRLAVGSTVPTASRQARP